MISHNYKVIIARHGETDGNKLHIIQRHDTPLNETGLSQAEQLAEDLKLLGNFNQIICSPLLRARQTAGIVSSKLELPITEFNEIFCERDLGFLKGLSHAEVIEKFPEMYDFEYKHIRFNIRPEGGESFDDVKERARKAIEVINSFQSDTIIISHGNFIRGLMDILGRNEELPTGPMNNGQIFWINQKPL